MKTKANFSVKNTCKDVQDKIIGLEEKKVDLSEEERKRREQFSIRKAELDHEYNMAVLARRPKPNIWVDSVLPTIGFGFLVILPVVVPLLADKFMTNSTTKRT